MYQTFTITFKGSVHNIWHRLECALNAMQTDHGMQVKRVQGANPPTVHVWSTLDRDSIRRLLLKCIEDHIMNAEITVVIQ